MSQSDYIKYKKTINELNGLNQHELPSVLNSQTYTSFKTYSLETSSSNTKTPYQKLVPSNKKIIFDMELKTTNCPTFAMCRATNNRPNRVLNVGLLPTGLPTCMKYINKSETEKTCTSISGYVKNSCVCSHKICKCSTKICKTR